RTAAIQSPAPRAPAAGPAQTRVHTREQNSGARSQIARRHAIEKAASRGAQNGCSFCARWPVVTNLIAQQAKAQCCISRRQRLSQRSICGDAPGGANL